MKKNIDTIINITIIMAFFLTTFIWSMNFDEKYAPDEWMRYLVPKYIYNHNSLPAPDNVEVVASAFNASYAYYPLLLGSVMSAAFMKIVGIFNANEFVLLVAARFTSVLFGTIFVFFMIQIAKKIFERRGFRLLLVIMTSFIPQLIYLSSYINNDIIALAASAMIVYAWVLALDFGWNLKNSILLSFGIIICALSYYNAYAWILMSIVMFVLLFLEKNEFDLKLHFDYKSMLKYGSVIAIIVLCGISFFFIRNMILNHGDMLGMRSFLNACEEGGWDEVKPSNRTTPQNLNMSIKEMLTTTDFTGDSWIHSTYISFICVLGCIQYPINNACYNFYGILFGVGIIGMLAKVIKTKNKKDLLFYFSLLVCLIVPILLSIKYSYSTDYQAQGRYLYPIWTSLVLFVTMGIEKILYYVTKVIKNEKTNKIIETVVVVILCLIILYIMYIKANELFFMTIKF